MALEYGFNVVLKNRFSLEALLKQKVLETGLILCLIHTYSGYQW
jgi:hypothetical protein